MSENEIVKAFESALYLQDFCSEQDECENCIFYKTHQKWHDDFAYKDEEGSPCLLNRMFPVNWCMGITRGEYEGKACENCKHEDTKVCYSCRHCYENWEKKEELKNDNTR